MTAEPRTDSDGVTVTVAGVARTLDPGAYVIGRGADADVDVSAPLVSRRHAVVEYRDGRWTVRDLGSVNGIWHEGERVAEVAVEQPVTVRLGGPEGMAVTIAPSGPGTAEAVGTKEVVIGRTPGNTLVLDDLLVSRRHAALTSTAEGAELRDLGSGNGTFVNGRRIDRCLLRPGDLVGIGTHTFRFDGSRLVELDLSAGAELSATDLRVEVDGRRLVDDVSFSLPPRTLMAVVGPSGAGKSTMMSALAGLRAPTHGTVRHGGRNLFEDYDELRRRIGFVPQQDALHSVLTVRQALGYAARLRFPADTSAAERDARVREVAAELTLEDRLDTRVSLLSGGERKRAGTATELLTRPPLLFLDEPTSGLDVDLDRDVMRHLRRLADDGRTVVVVTHNLDNLGECDLVMVLARGGRLAYLGPPGGAFGYFDVTSWADLFSTLKTRPPDEWAARFRDAPDRDPRAQAPDNPSPARSDTPRPPASPSRDTARGRQWTTLFRRQLAVTVADRVLLGILVLLPLLLAGIARVIPASQGLARIPGNTDASQLLLVLAVGAALTGAAGTVQELVKERPLYRHERAVGLSPGAYLAAKVVVFTAIGAVQGAVLTLLALAGRRPPDGAVVLADPILEITAVVALATAVSALLGLLVSAAVGDENQTMPLLVLVTMAQLVFSGGLVPLHGRPVLEQLSWLFPARWGFAATAATTDLRYVRAEPDGDPLWAPSAGTWWLDVGVLVALGVVAIAVTAVLLRRRPLSDR
jgi:ABC transport system ATP-binding/permease protein